MMAYSRSRYSPEPMADIVDPATRSRMMSGIRGRNTKPEMMVRSLLHREGFRFRLHVSKLPGKPDIVLPRYCSVIFVHGCFWHGHNCPLFRLPGTRRDFWCEKISRNKANDQIVQDRLRGSGWRVGIVWECSLRGTGKDPGKVIRQIDSWLRGKQETIEIRG